MNPSPEIKARERDAIMQSLQAGLVPKLGLHLLQVGRKPEVSAVLKDLDRIGAQGAAFRFVVGNFGSGKSFFLNLVRALALQRRMVVLQADMAMGRRFHATGGEARALWSELIKNLATRTRPDGGGLRTFIEAWIGTLHSGDPKADAAAVRQELRPLTDLVGGFEFTEILAKYAEGHATGNDQVQSDAMKWLRGEFETKTEARKALGVGRIIDDESFYDSLKVLARFCHLAGAGGLLILIDELVVLSHRLPSSRARQSNYEAILTMMNDCLQGGASGLGFLLAGTTECIEDKRRGLCSYEALRSRVAGNALARDGLVDLSGPVLRLPSLTPEELYVLLSNVRTVHASGQGAPPAVPDECLIAVLEQASEVIGADFFRTPRDVVRGFVGLLNVLEQNPGTAWQDVVGRGVVQKAATPVSVEEAVAAGGVVPEDNDDDLATIRI